jgi:hypothetical protein
MRASGTLGVACVLAFVSMVATPAAGAVNGKSAKAQRAAPVVTVPPPRPPLHPTVAAKSFAQAQPRPALPLPPPAAPPPPANTERRPAAPAPTLAATARAAQPEAAAAVSPAALRAPIRPGARIGGGTPILPVAQSSGLSCVPFARMATGMTISGNGGRWWHNAAGLYQRGHEPERGAILAMPGSGTMHLGHVAVVSRVLNDRQIEVDHANWGGPGLRRGQVLRGALVVDVSDRGDWSAVRVQVGHDRTQLGRTYPVQGFIYNRPTTGETLSVEAPRLEQLASIAE